MSGAHTAESLALASEEQRCRVLVAGALAAVAAVLAQLESASGGSALRSFDDAALYMALVGEHVRERALRSGRALGLIAEGASPEGRLLDAPELVPGARELSAQQPHELGEATAEALARDLGMVLEGLLAHGIRRRGTSREVTGTRARKQSGSFYTPPALSDQVVQACLEALTNSARFPRVRVCDPAAGAGAFLLASCRALAPRLSAAENVPLHAARRLVVEHCLYGADISPLAVSVAETALWLYAADATLTPRAAGAHLQVADTLLEDFAEPDFDLVIGNPPWVAFAGRAAQPLSATTRQRYAARYMAFKGYPTLHGLFVERAAELAPRGTIALLLPSPIADLDGYRNVRLALTRTHVVRAPLVEFGQDAFATVTQPCFALVADASPAAASDARPFKLSERQRREGEARELEVPEAVTRLLDSAALPPELFGEMGFQSRRVITETLFRRAPEAAPDDYPLLEGKDVAEFRVGQPRLFLRPDRELLKRAGCRLRTADDYRRVRFVVRQTAKVTIAALHTGLPFRNTLLAGFDHAHYPPELLVGLLNSALYRAIHLAARRDARQAVFPQVKIAHLRSLPRPPADPERCARIAELSRRATAHGMQPGLRALLDREVFELFGLCAEDARAVIEFVSRRAPELGHSHA